LLDEHRPNLHWRVLAELVGRPVDSAAVVRAMGGASACEPVATLLADLHPDGSWVTPVGMSRRYGGPWWRLIAAVQLGADPSDPRLDAAAGRLLDRIDGVGGFSAGPNQPESAVLTARLVQTVACLGFIRHLRVQEALAWFEEDRRAWNLPLGQLWTVATALLAALASGGLVGHPLRKRLGKKLIGLFATAEAPSTRYGHPNLARTDLSEVLWALARIGVPWDERLAGPLRLLQSAQNEQGRWPSRRAVPQSLPVKPDTFETVGEPSRWITLRAVVALNAYAVPAQLPRLFPEKPTDS
jgi:hypothetical protein